MKGEYVQEMEKLKALVDLVKDDRVGQSLPFSQAVLPNPPGFPPVVTFPKENLVRFRLHYAYLMHFCAFVVQQPMEHLTPLHLMSFVMKLQEEMENISPGDRL